MLVSTVLHTLNVADLLDETLVDSHLEQIPGLGTLTVRSLTGGDLEGLGWEADWALDAEVLGLGALNELGADLLEGGDLAGGEGDADLVGLLLGGGISVCLLIYVVCLSHAATVLSS
jgi:hypothetical protein